VTGAAYGAVVVLVFAALDPPFDDGVGELLAATLLIGAWAAGFGSLCAVLPGALGGLVLALLAELGAGRRRLVLAGTALGAGMGLLWLSAYSAVVDGPTLRGTGDTLLWRIGPGVAGALGAAWQGARTPLRPG
jgi:hypothetical protein